MAAPAVADFVLQRGEIIDGTVTADDTGEPLPDVCVIAWTAEEFEFGAESCTDLDGHYALTVRPDLGYKIEATAFNGDYIGEWYNDKIDSGTADVVTGPARADFALQRAGTLQGTVTLFDGTAPEFAFVTVTDVDGDSIDGTGTDESGQWSVAVRPGAYKILAEVEGLKRWAIDAPDVDSADVFDVAGGQTVTVATIVLPPPATVEGVVVDAKTHGPIEGVCVDVIPTIEDVGSGGACTDPDGRYVVTNLSAGAYKIHFQDFDGVYVEEWHRGADREDRARVVTIEAGETVTVNAELRLAGHVTGHVVDAATAEPVVGVCVIARDPKTLDTVGLGDCTNDQGAFTLGGVPSGDVLVSTLDRGDYPAAYTPGTWDRDDAARFKVEAGEQTDVGEIALPLGGVLRGRVTNEAGEPIEGIVVTPLGGIDRSGESKTARTVESGEYELRGLSGPLVPGVFDPTGDYGFQWSGGAADPSIADPVEIRSSQTTLLDWVLKPGSVLLGTVVDESGDPIALDDGFELVAHDLSGRLEISSAFVDLGQSTFEARGLPDGPVLLRVLSEDIWYDGATSATKADPIPLAAGETTEIVFTLPSP